MIAIDIDETSCIKCGKCVKVCPAYILTQESQKADIGLEHVESCIICGHCVAICPTNSVIHSEFPPQKVHELDRKMMPNPEQMLELCRGRRSNRAFLSTPIPEKSLKMIVEAGYLAPTASNEQEVSFTLVTDPEILKQISKLTIDVFKSMVKKVNLPLVKPILGLFAPHAKEGVEHLESVINEFKNKPEVILRGATALLFIHTPAKSNFGKQDANLAYQNASLMAETLGVSQFYTGYVCISNDLDNKKRLKDLLKIQGEIQAGMALGMPAFKFHKYIDRKELDLTVF